MIDRYRMTELVCGQVAAERRRQVEIEGFTLDHDDMHRGDLATAGATYALADERPYLALDIWPWTEESFKPKDQRRNLIRAAALIVAEIERIDRLAVEDEAEYG